MAVSQLDLFIERKNCSTIYSFCFTTSWVKPYDKRENDEEPAWNIEPKSEEVLLLSANSATLMVRSRRIHPNHHHPKHHHPGVLHRGLTNNAPLIRKSFLRNYSLCHNVFHAMLVEE